MFCSVRCPLTGHLIVIFFKQPAYADVQNFVIYTSLIFAISPIKLSYKNLNHIRAMDTSGYHMFCCQCKDRTHIG